MISDIQTLDLWLHDQERGDSSLLVKRKGRFKQISSKKRLKKNDTLLSEQEVSAFIEKWIRGYHEEQTLHQLHSIRGRLNSHIWSHRSSLSRKERKNNSCRIQEEIDYKCTMISIKLLGQPSLQKLCLATQYLTELLPLMKINPKKSLKIPNILDSIFESSISLFSSPKKGDLCSSPSVLFWEPSILIALSQFQLSIPFKLRERWEKEGLDVPSKRINQYFTDLALAVMAKRKRSVQNRFQSLFNYTTEIKRILLLFCALGDPRKGEFLVDTFFLTFTQEIAKSEALSSSQKINLLNDIYSSLAYLFDSRAGEGEEVLFKAFSIQLNQTKISQEIESLKELLQRDLFKIEFSQSPKEKKNHD